MIVLMGNHDKWFLNFLEGKDDAWIYGFRSPSVLDPFLNELQIEGFNYIINKMKPGRAKTEKLTKYVRDCLIKNHGDLIKWYKNLPLYYKTDIQIFVHAGIDEEAGEYWHVGTSDDMFIEKYPPTTGEFYMDIIAGHVSTSTASGEKNRHDIYFDGESHFFIDRVDSYPNNTWDDDRIIPVLVYESSKDNNNVGHYYSLQENGTKILIK